MDAALKETEFDVVLVGTGMAEAILAGALARAGKKVLHLDQNDYYGSNYASLPLASFRRWIQNESSSPRAFNDEGEATTHSETGTEPERGTVVVPMTSSLRCDLLEEAFADAETREQLLAQSSAFSVDVSPRLLLASEELVEVLITSGVGRYLEFAAVENTYVLLSSAEPSAEPSAEHSAQDAVWEVPCSKKDVFQSKLLGMVEKRQLMKFLQFVADYGETHFKHEDVATTNERSLALGRALQRPQNKASQAASAAVAPFLDGPFQKLLERHFKLSPKLQQVVVYCVALASFPVGEQQEARHGQQMTARDGLAAVYRYVSSIGRFTGTALLVPLYGVSEIAQSFCRLCAVYGGVYVLRAPVDGFVVDAESRDVVGVHCTDGGTVRAKQAVVVNGSYLACLRSWSSDGTRDGGAVEPPLAHGKVLRGVFLLRASLRGSKSRVVVAIPPHDAKLQNPFAVHVVQVDYGAYVCPRGYFLVHMSMPLPSEWSRDSGRQRAFVLSVMEALATSALAQQAAVKKGDSEGHDTAALPPRAASVSTDDATGDPSTEAWVEPTTEPEALQPAWRKLVAWHSIFTVDHLTAGGASAAAERSSQDEATADPSVAVPGLPGHVWVCETAASGEAERAEADAAPRVPVRPLEMHLESASANARAIFEQLCPGEAFLPKSASAEQAEQEELAGDEDAVLEAAQRLAQSAALSAAPRAPADVSDGGDDVPRSPRSALSAPEAAADARGDAHSP